MQLSEEKILCLSGKEFAILADVCGIRNLICFQTDEDDMPALPDRQEYPVIVHGLIKRGILKSADDGIELTPDTVKLFVCIRSAAYTFRFIRNNGINKVSSCIYVGTTGEFVSALPGSRHGEYIRLCLHNKDVLPQWLNDVELSDADSVFSGLGSILVSKGIRDGIYAEYTSEQQPDGSVRFAGKDGAVFYSAEITSKLLKIAGGNS